MTAISNDPDPLDLPNTSSPATEQIVDKSQLADHQQEFEHIEGEFEINDDLKLYEQVWLPPGGANGDSIQAKATIVIVHGFGEHSGRYRPLALQLINNGFAVYAYDQRGHGKSGGIRAYIDSWDEYVSDFERAMVRVYESAGDMPIFILGHSMGGLVQASYLIKHKDQINRVALAISLKPFTEEAQEDMTTVIPIAGVIFSSALLCMPANVSPILLALSGIVNAVRPKMQTIKVDASVLSKDEYEVDKYTADPLVYHGGMPVRTGVEIRQAVEALQPQLIEIEVPFLVFHGTEDQLTDPKGSEYLYYTARSMDKMHKVYYGGFHEMLNSPEKKIVTADILAWLNARAK